MIESLEELKKYDLVELEKFHDDWAMCLARIINTLNILEKRTYKIIEGLRGWIE